MATKKKEIQDVRKQNRLIKILDIFKKMKKELFNKPLKDGERDQRIINIIKDNEIHTPIPDCFLNGITRQTVIQMVKDQGFNLIERYIKPEELNKFDEIFLTGTAAEITPVKSIDSLNFNTGEKWSSNPPIS